MKKIFQNLSGKRSMTVYLDGRIIETGELEVLEHQNTYVLSDRESQAKELFSNEKTDVVCGSHDTVRVSESWASLVACAPKNKEEFKHFSERASQINGIIVYSYDDLFDCKNEREMRDHFHACINLYGLIHINHIQENGKRYLIAKRTHTTLINRVGFESLASLFCGPIIDSSILAVKIVSRNAGWSYPSVFTENHISIWKSNHFFELENTVDSFFETASKPKFVGGSIEIPNHEQIAILLASGSIDKEIVLADGRIVILKGTEQLSVKNRVKLDLEGKPVAHIEQQVRNTVIYELDMTHGDFCKLV